MKIVITGNELGIDKVKIKEKGMDPELMSVALSGAAAALIVKVADAEETTPYEIIGKLAAAIAMADITEGMFGEEDDDEDSD